MCVAEVKKEVEEGDEPRAETESESEEELSCFAPLVSTTLSAILHQGTRTVCCLCGHIYLYLWGPEQKLDKLGTFCWTPQGQTLFLGGLGLRFGLGLELEVRENLDFEWD